MNAYKRAGSAFKGQMQQNFVVLNEHGFGADVVDSAKAGPCGAMICGKRPRDEGRPRGSWAPQKSKLSLYLLTKINMTEGRARGLSVFYLRK
jgi:hypothetical protein